jgi:hypothetical protein
MLPLLSVDGCYGGSFEYAAPFYCVPLSMLRSHLRASFVATFCVAVGLLYRCPCILN